MRTFFAHSLFRDAVMLFLYSPLLYGLTFDIDKHRKQGFALNICDGVLSLTEFPEGNSSSGSHIEGVHLMRHGDAHHEVGFGYSLRGESIALGAHDEG